MRFIACLLAGLFLNTVAWAQQSAPYELVEDDGRNNIIDVTGFGACQLGVGCRDIDGNICVVGVPGAQATASSDSCRLERVPSGRCSRGSNTSCIWPFGAGACSSDPNRGCLSASDCAGSDTCSAPNAACGCTSATEKSICGCSGMDATLHAADTIPDPTALFPTLRSIGAGTFRDATVLSVNNTDIVIKARELACPYVGLCSTDGSQCARDSDCSGAGGTCRNVALTCAVAP